MTPPVRTNRARSARQDGFTMITALGVMFITSLILIAAFAVANGDMHLSHSDTTQKQAYYAALAGVQEYEHQLQANPDYWQTCEGPSSPALEGAAERYEVKVLPANSAPKGTTECSASNPFATVIESEGVLANTFRIKSTGYAKTAGYQGSAKREIVATFHVTGFLDFLYFTNYEQGDPAVLGAPAECEKKTYSQWSSEKLACAEIQFTTGDHVNGPMHTNDSAKVVGEPTFGRKGQAPADVVEINGGTRPEEGCGESTTATYYTATKCFTKGTTLEPPENDTTLAAYVEGENQFEGATHLELKGTTIAVTYYNAKEEEAKKTLSWPKNGLIYVQAGKSGCGYKYNAKEADTSSELSEEKGCGNVYVSGNYSKSLTVGAENDLIVNGSLYPTTLEGKLGNEPTGTTVLGLIASKYVRIYHPCSRENEAGSLKNPYIYAGILSTSHSFLVDNWECGEPLGELHVYGAIGQNYRGPVGTGSTESVASGYLKDYKYDGRLATEEPPYFLAPLKAGWKIERETAPNFG
jgi:Tfp pilus assembly protein PilX